MLFEVILDTIIVVIRILILLRLSFSSIGAWVCDEDIYSNIFHLFSFILGNNQPSWIMI